MNSRGKDGGRERRVSVDKFRSYTQRLHNREYNSDQQRDRHAGLYSPDCTVTYNTSISNSPPTHNDIVTAAEVIPNTRLSVYSKEKKSGKKIRSSYKRDQDNRSPIFPCAEDDEVGAIIGHGISDEESEGYREAVFRSVEWQQSNRPRLSPERRSSISPHQHNYCGSPIILSDIGDDEDNWEDKWNLRDQFDKRQRIEGGRMPYRMSMNRNDDRHEYKDMMDNDRVPSWFRKGRRNYEQDDVRKTSSKDDRLDRRSDYGSHRYERNHAVDRDLNRKYWYSRQDSHIGDSRGHVRMENRERGMSYDYMGSGQYERKDDAERRPLPDERPGPSFSRKNDPRVKNDCESNMFSQKIDSSKGVSEITKTKSADCLRRNEGSGNVSPLPCWNDNSVPGSIVKTNPVYMDVNRKDAPHAFSPIADIDRNRPIIDTQGNRREPIHSFFPVQERPSIDRSKLGVHSYDIRRVTANSISPIPSRKAFETDLTIVDSCGNRGGPSRPFSPMQPRSAIERNMSGLDSHDIRTESPHAFSPIPSRKAFESNLSGEDSHISRRNSPRSFSPIPSQKAFERNLSRVDSHVRRESPHSFSPIPSQEDFERNISVGNSYGNMRESTRSFSATQPRTVVERNIPGLESHIRREESPHSLSPVQSGKAIERQLSGIDSYGNRREPTRSFSQDRRKSRKKSHHCRRKNLSPLDPFDYRNESQRSFSPTHPFTSAKRDSYDDNRRKKTSRSHSPILHRSDRDRRRTGIRSHDTRRELPRSYSPTASVRNILGDPYGNRRERPHSFSPIHSRAVERSTSGIDTYGYRRDHSFSPTFPGTTVGDSSGIGLHGRSEGFSSYPPELSHTGEDRSRSEVYRYDERRDPSSILAQPSAGINSLGVGSGDGGAFSFPPLPPPPPPPPILSTFSSASSFSKTLPVKPSLTVDLDSVRQSMQILEKLKKKQEIVSKCDMKIRELYRKRMKLSNEPSAFFLIVNKTDHNTSSVIFCNSELRFNSTGPFNSQLTSSHSQASSSGLNPTFSSDQTNLEMSCNQLSYSSLIKDSGSNVLCQPDESSILDKECKGLVDPHPSERLSLNHPLSIPSQLNRSSNIDCITYQSSSLSMPQTFASSYETDKSHITTNYENQSQSRGSGWPVKTSSVFKENSRFKPTSNISVGPPPNTSHDTPEPVIRPVKRSQPSRSQITLNLLPKANTCQVSSKEESSYENKVEEFLARIQGNAGSDNSCELSRDTVNDFSKSNRNTNKPPFSVQTSKNNINPHENKKLGHGFDNKRPKLLLTSDVSPKVSTGALECHKFVVSSDEDDDVIYIGETNCKQELLDHSKDVVGGSANFLAKNSHKQSCTDLIEKETLKSDTVSSGINVASTIQVNLSANHFERTQAHLNEKDRNNLSKKEMADNAKLSAICSSSLKTIIGPGKDATNISSKSWRTDAHFSNLHETKCLKTITLQDDSSSKSNSSPNKLLQKTDFCQKRSMSSASDSAINDASLQKRRDFSELGDEPPGTSPSRLGSPLASISKAEICEDKPKKVFPAVVQTTMAQRNIGCGSMLPKLTVTQTSNLKVVVGGKKIPPNQMQTIPRQEKQSHPCANKTNLIVVDNKVSKMTSKSSPVIHIVPQSCKHFGSKENLVEELRETIPVGSSRNEIIYKSNEAENTLNKDVSLTFDLPHPVDEEKQPSKQNLETAPIVQTSYEGFKDIFKEGNKIAKCIEDIQRNDDRLQKVYLNTLRNKTINKSLCIMNGMLCLENEKIGARIVASTIEEKIIHYLHCYLQHHNDNLPLILKDYFTPIKELGKKVKTAMKLCDECSKRSSSCKEEIDCAEASELHLRNSDPLSEYVDSDSESDPMSIVRKIQTSSKHVENIMLRMGKEESELYVLRNKLLLKRCCSGENNVFKIFVPNDKIKEIILVAHMKFSEHGDLNYVAGILDKQFSPIDLVHSHINSVISTCPRCSV